MNRKEIRSNRVREGFTLIEVLLVVVIIGILVGVAVPKLSGRVREAQVSGTRQTIRAVGVALDVYEVDNGTYPSSLQNLLTSSGESNWNGPYIKDARMPKDAWGNVLQFSIQANGYKIVSGGPDGSIGGSDDITN